MSENTLLSEMDIKAVKDSGREATVVIVYTNMDLLKDVAEVKSTQVEHGDAVGALQYK